jgi:death-on-curing protein
MLYPEFGDFCDVAAGVLGITPEQVARFPNVGLADSALAAPRADFGDVERYPTLLEKAAVLLEHLTRNHRLPDASRRSVVVVL